MNDARNFRPAATTALERASLPTTCQCCGRENLVRTVKMTDGSAVMWMGVGCAAKATGVRAREINATERAMQKVADAFEEKVRQAESNAEFKRWSAHLDARCPELRGDVFRQIQALGGMKLARVGYTIG